MRDTKPRTWWETKECLSHTAVSLGICGDLRKRCEEVTGLGLWLALSVVRNQYEVSLVHFAVNTTRVYFPVALS